MTAQANPVDTYLQKTEQHIFSIEGKNVRKRIVRHKDPKNGSVYGVLLTFDDDNEDVKIKIFPAFHYKATSPKGKVYKEPRLSNFVLFNDDEGKHYAFRGGRFYEPLSQFVRGFLIEEGFNEVQLRVKVLERPELWSLKRKAA